MESNSINIKEKNEDVINAKTNESLKLVTHPDFELTT